jgi:uncharacterized protein
MDKRLSNRYDWESLGDVVKKKISYEKTGHDYDHTMRVLNNAMNIAEHHRGIDYDVLVASCLLHDIRVDAGNIKEHHIKSSIEAVKILSKMKFSSDTIEKVKHAIINHNRGFSTKGIDKDIDLSIEAKILCDADRLDALGAIGIVRMTLFSSEQKIPFFISNSDKLDESLYGNMKFMAKIGTNMFTPQARLIAWQRIVLMNAFNGELSRDCAKRR